MAQGHRYRFSRDEVRRIKELLDSIRAADPDRQKALRGQLRRLGFYISAFAGDQSGFTASEVDRLISRGVIKLSDEPGASTSRFSERSNDLESGASSGAGHCPESEGHRRRVNWMDTEVETLDDLIRPGLKALCIGINPAPSSVAVGQYYQGRLGQQFFKRLQKAGAIRFSGGWQDDEAFEQGVGFTDIVKRPTASAAEVTAEEFAYGRDVLRNKIHALKPPLLIFSFKKAAQALFGSIDGNGLIAGTTMEGARVYVMPGPYAKRDEVSTKLQELSELTS